MSGKSLSNISSEATQVQNTPGVTTPILEFRPDDGTLFKLLNQIGLGSSDGLAIVADLKDSNGNPLSTNTAIVLRVKRPTDDEPVAISVKQDNIASYNSLSTQKQRNEENIDSVKHELKAPSVNITYRDVLRVELNGPDQIDWSNSELYILRQGVREMSYSG